MVQVTGIDVGVAEPDQRTNAFGPVATAAGEIQRLAVTRMPIDLAPVTAGTVIARMDSLPSAQEWFEAERAALLAAARLAHDTGFADHARRLAWAMATFLDHGGFWSDRASLAALGGRHAVATHSMDAPRWRASIPSVG